MKTIISKATTVMTMLVVVINCSLFYKIIALSDTPTNNDMLPFVSLLDEMDKDKEQESVNHYNSCKRASLSSTPREQIQRAISEMEQILAVQDSALTILEKIRLSANNSEEAENHFISFRTLILRNTDILTQKSRGVQIDWYFGRGIVNGEKLLDKSLLSPNPNIIILKSIALRSDLLYSTNALLRHLCSG